ncbi:VOC family protein, partial [Burkholderia pseudomallei]|nr:VOC family protein [Burkholderia pseudomallei]MBF3543487.1 VOC family protein [Burkholderia pseudomallei]MBF3728173.1 VOC family protein [Burkholderia pseudomallei]MBF3728214.1 VOC family protein [Burkholderia pseudomallei]
QDLTPEQIREGMASCVPPAQ